jgi:hypothetical protein
MTTTTEPVYDMAQLDKVKGEISLTKIREAANLIASILTLQHCDIDESQGYGHAWIILEGRVWLSKNGVTAIVPLPTKPAAFAGTTSADKFIYKAALKNYTDYKTHCNGAIKMIKYIFDKSCFLDLEDAQGQMIGHTPHDILSHIYTANVEEEDHDDEIIVIEERMRQEYDPNEQPQVYFRELQTCRTLLLHLQVDCQEKTLIRTAMNQFQKQMDLNDAVDRWKEKETHLKTWMAFKAFFGKEIRKNKNRKGTFKAIGLANAVTQQQVETNRENQQILTANSIEQNNVIESLQAQIAALTTAVTTATPPPPPPPPPAQANAAATTTDANAKMMETMMAMMNKMKTSGSTGDTSGSGGGGGGKKKKYLPRDNDKDGKRTTRRYNNDNYC